MKQLFAKKSAIVDLKQPYYNKKIVRFFYNIIMHPWFDATIIFAIILNTLCLALDRSTPYPEWFSYITKVLNYIFTAVFLVEAVVKLIGMGIRPYIVEKMN